MEQHNVCFAAARPVIGFTSLCLESFKISDTVFHKNSNSKSLETQISIQKKPT